MKSVTAVFNHHSRGLFAALALVAFAATIIFVGSFAAVDADDGTEETYAVDSYDTDAEFPDDNAARNIRINFVSNNTNWGTVTLNEQSVSLPDSSYIIAPRFVLGDIGVVVTLRLTVAIILPIPTWVGFNFAIPADGYEMDYWTINDKRGGLFDSILRDTTIVAHFKEKGTEIVP